MFRSVICNLHSYCKLDTNIFTLFTLNKCIIYTIKIIVLIIYAFIQECNDYMDINLSCRYKNIKPLALLFAIRVLWSVGYVVFYGSLSLFLSEKMNMSATRSASTVGVFISIGYILPIVGGAITNKYISNKRIYILCNLIQCIGLLILLNRNLHVFLFGLSLFLIGTVTNVTSINILITKMYNANDTGRERSFLWSYAAINFGFTLGYFLSGYYGINYFNILMIISACFLFFNIVIFVYYYKLMEVKANDLKNENHLLVLSLLFISILATYILLSNSVSASLVVLTFGFLSIAWIIRSSVKLNSYGIFFFAFLLIIAIFFWAAYFITPTIFFNYLNNYVDLTLFGIKLAPQWFGSINSLLIIVGCPMLAMLYKRVKNLYFMKSTVSIFFTSFSCIFVATLFLYIGTKYYAQSKIPAIFPILYLIFQSIGEILIAPMLYSIVGEFVPKNKQTLMTGFCVIPLCVGSVVSGLLLKFLTPVSESHNMISLLTYNNIFRDITILLAIVGVICFLIYKTILCEGSVLYRLREIEKSNFNLILTDYICWMLFSVISGFYLILPVYFVDVYHFTYVKATFLVSLYLVGRAVGMLSYVRLLKHALKILILGNIATERLLLIISGFIASILLVGLANFKDYNLMLFVIFILGIIASSFGSLNMSIMNGNTFNKNKEEHSSLQRWFQNIGMTLTFLLFAFWHDKHFNIFYIFSSVLVLACLLEFVNIRQRISNENYNNTQNSKAILKKPIIFFIMILLSLIVFMQIPNLYAYFIHDHYKISSDLFSLFMIINSLSVVLFQFPISKYFIERLERQYSAALGLSLIGFGAVLPIFNNLIFVYLSFIIWTVGEIFMFTAFRSYLMTFSSGDPKQNFSISVRYYTIYYLSNLTCPIVIKYMYGFVNSEILLVILFGFSLVISLFWIFRSDYFNFQEH